MKKKLLTLSFDCGTWEATFELTDINRAAPSCRASLNFFRDLVRDEGSSDEEAVTACLKMFGRTVMHHALHGGVDYVREQMAKEEGYFPLDGTHGLRLHNCDELEFPEDFFDVEWPEQKTQEAA